MNFVVQKTPKSNPEIVHIDRLTHFHGNVPKAWKTVLDQEDAMALEKTISEDEACASATDNVAARAKNAVSELDANVSANANVNEGEASASESVSDNAGNNACNADTDSDLMYLTDGIVELTDANSDTDEVFDNGNYFDISDIVNVKYKKKLQMAILRML